MRSPILTPALIATLVCDIQKGHFVDTVCKRHGVPRATFYRWLRKGEQGEPEYTAFYEAITAARAQAEMDLFEVVKDGDDLHVEKDGKIRIERGGSFGKSRAALELLKCMHPKKYAARLQVKVEEEAQSLLDVLEQCIGGKACSCYEEVLAALAARETVDEELQIPPELAEELERVEH